MAATHFTRFLDRQQIRALQRMLEDAAGRKIRVDLRGPTFEVKAPDGDVVFAGLRHPSGRWICRLHREVFSKA